MVKLFRTKRYSEEVDTIPIVDSRVEPIQNKVILSLPVGELQKDDQLIVSGEIEFTNDAGYLTSVVSQIVLARSPTATSGDLISYPNGTNVDTDLIHHLLITKVGTLVVDKHIDNAYINFVSHSDSFLKYESGIRLPKWLSKILNFKRKSSHEVKVENGYGNMSCMILPYSS